MTDPFSDPHTAAVEEIKRLHDFIAGWFRGDEPAESFDAAFTDMLSPEFENIQPAGRVLSLSELIDPIRDAHGSNPDFQIEIRDPRLLGTYPKARLIHATYIEAQSGARNSVPPENLRRSTVLFSVQGRHLIWRHLHETAVSGTSDR